MGWGGNVPEFSRAPGRMENFPTVKEYGRGAHDSLESGLRLAAASHAARCRFNPCRQTGGQSQSRKSASGSSVVERRGGSGRAGGFQSSRCRRIFSITLGLSMKLRIRRLPQHLGPVKGSARYTFRMRRAQARLQKRRKSSFWPASGHEAAPGIAVAVFCRRRFPRALLLP